MARVTRLFLLLGLWVAACGGAAEGGVLVSADSIGIDCSVSVTSGAGRPHLFPQPSEEGNPALGATQEAMASSLGAFAAGGGHSACVFASSVLDFPPRGVWLVARDAAILPDAPFYSLLKVPRPTSA